MFKPPENRAMRVLDRTFFMQENTIAAAQISSKQGMQKALKELRKSNDILEQPKIKIVQPVPSKTPDDKCVLLRPGIKYNDRKTWSEAVERLVVAGEVDVMPYTLQLSYENWDRGVILASILPDELQDEIPNNYNHAGHVAHLTLNEPYLPYKHLIGQIFLDKTPGVRTVINKVETLDEDEDNTFRTLKYEILAGEDDLNVEAKEGGSTFRFDYSKVFWNSKLGNEHGRIVSKFRPGEAVCDVMAGVGPFAVPAGRKGVFVWANDLNPDCYTCLKDAISLNKVHQFVTPSSEDGHTFIFSSARALLKTEHTAQISKGIPASEIKARKLQESDLYNIVSQPKIFSHYVMNLPSTAMDFLPDYIGLYAGHEELFTPESGNKLPMVHCYCFVHGEGPRAPTSEDESVRQEVCARVSAKLAHEITLEDEELEIYDVRNVAPKKTQMCVSFRLPREVAFRKAA